MSILQNEIIIEAPIQKIWDVLAQVDELEQYDPTVKKSTTLSDIKSGIGAKRKVTMSDGKNWFEETCSVAIPNESLEYQLTACSFPVHKLKHSYSFETVDNKTRLIQTMNYTMKYGVIGKLMDLLMVKTNQIKELDYFLRG